MFGGPWLGLIVFIVIAIALGWGVTKFFQAAGDAMQSVDAFEGHGFDPEVVYTLKRDLLIGVNSEGQRKVLFPARDDLPVRAFNRLAVPTIEQARAMSPDELLQADLIGVVEANTRVRFVDLYIKPAGSDRGADVMVELMDGPYAGLDDVLGMHLESADTIQETGAKRYVPRTDLFEKVDTAGEQVQSTP